MQDKRSDYPLKIRRTICGARRSPSLLSKVTRAVLPLPLTRADIVGDLFCAARSHVGLFYYCQSGVRLDLRIADAATHTRQCDAGHSALRISFI
jgi:hypothetical protein